MNLGQALRQSFALLPPKLFSMAPVVQQRILESSQDIVRDVDVFEDLPKAVSEFLLTKIGEPALSAKAGAAIVGVFLFLYFRRHFAIVVGTS